MVGWWAVAGDRLLFYYSGHGAQYPARDGDGELDGFKEVLCPFDFDWTEETMISDKEMVEIFYTIPIGVAFNIISDSCHSAGQFRGTDGAKSFPMPVDLQWRMRATKVKYPQDPDDYKSELNAGFLSGCKSDQFSEDTWFEDAGCRGALSYYFQKRVVENKDLPMDKICELVLADLKAGGHKQEPQISGRRSSKPFLVV